MSTLGQLIKPREKPSKGYEPGGQYRRPQDGQCQAEALDVPTLDKPIKTRGKKIKLIGKGTNRGRYRCCWGGPCRGDA
jgi:hypothetical protein